MRSSERIAVHRRCNGWKSMWKAEKLVLAHISSSKWGRVYPILLCAILMLIKEKSWSKGHLLMFLWSLEDYMPVSRYVCTKVDSKNRYPVEYFYSIFGLESFNWDFYSTEMETSHDTCDTWGLAVSNTYNIARVVWLCFLHYHLIS